MTKTMKTVIAVDVGPHDTPMNMLAITIMTAIQAARSKVGISVGAEVQLFSSYAFSYAWMQDRENLDNFMRAVAVKLDLPLRIQYEDSPRDIAVRVNQLTDDVDVRGVLLVRPGVCVTEEMVKFTSEIKEFAARTGRQIISLLGGKTEDEILALDHTAPCGKPAVIAERALVIDPNIVGNPDCKEEDIDDRADCFLFESEYFRKKAPAKLGFVGAVDSVAICDVYPLFNYAGFPSMSDALTGREPDRSRSYRVSSAFRGDEFPVNLLQTLRNSHATINAGTHEFVMGWLRQAVCGAELDIRPATELRNIIDVFTTFTSQHY